MPDAGADSFPDTRPAADALLDQQAPTVSLTAPRAGAVLSAPQLVTLAAEAADDVQVTRVEFYVGAVLVATDTEAPYRFEWPASAADNGPRTLVAKAYDAAGHTAQATVDVTVNIQPGVWERAFTAYTAAYDHRFLKAEDLVNSAVLSWGESYLLEALSAMYAATNNAAYLEAAQRHIDAILEAASQHADGSGWGWSTSRYSADKVANGSFAALAAANTVAQGLAVSVPEPWAALQSPDVCSSASALAADGVPAGLAYRGDATTSVVATVDGRDVTACLDVDFGAVEARGAAVIHYAMADALCGDTCSGSACGTNPGAIVFASADKVAWKQLGDLAHATTPGVARLPTPEPWRYLRVCRGGGGNARANLAIDAVTAMGGARTLPEGWTLGPYTTTDQAYRSTAAADAYRPSADDPAGLVITSPAGATRSLTQTLSSYMIRAPLKTFYDVSFMAKGTGQARVTIDGSAAATADFSSSAWQATTLTFEAPLSPGKAITLTFSAADGATAHVDSVKVQARVPYVVHDGMILHAIARFVQEVYARQPALAAFRPAAETYLRQLEQRFAGKWDTAWVDLGTTPAAGVYRIPDDAPEMLGSALYPAGSSLPHNQYLAFGRFLAVLYAITGEPLYKARAERMAQAFKAALPAQPDAQHYVWHYADKLLAQDPVRPANVEDVSHANIDVGFVTTLHRLGLVFSTADVQRLANTFLDKIWDAAALAGHARVDGTGALNDPGYQYFGEWITLGAIEPRVLGAIEAFLKGPNANKTSAAYPLMLAHLLLHQSR